MASLTGIETSCKYNLLSLFQDDMLKLRDTAESSGDVKFLISGTKQEYRLHSCVVAMRCEALRQDIRNFLAEAPCKGNDELTYVKTLPKLCESAVENVIDFLYSGEMVLPSEELPAGCTTLSDMLSLSQSLGLPSLQRILLCYIEEKFCIESVMAILDSALYKHMHPTIIEKLTEIFAERSFLLKTRFDYGDLSYKFWVHALRQEGLTANEDQLWKPLIQWSCKRRGITPSKTVQEMSRDERKKIASVMKGFCRPELFRILRFSVAFFATHVEPLGVFPPSEVLLKYRFDATIATEHFEKAFPEDRYSFMQRTRQTHITRESGSHPHGRGISHAEEVNLPRWVNQFSIFFDPQTELGKYAELIIFKDSSKLEQTFRLRSHVPAALSSTLPPSLLTTHCTDGSLIPPVTMSGNSFFFTFYAPHAVCHTGWGYKFTVSLMR